MKVILLSLLITIFSEICFAQGSPVLDYNNTKSELKETANTLTLTLPNIMEYRFKKYPNGWGIDKICIWNNSTSKWTEKEQTLVGEMGILNKKVDFENLENNLYIFANNYEIIKEDTISGIRFYGNFIKKSFIDMAWESVFYFDTKDSLPLLHSKLNYTFTKDISELYFPKVVYRTCETGADVKSAMTHINNFSHNDIPVLIEKGYPIIWLFTEIDKIKSDTLLINNVHQDRSDGRYFIFNKSPQSPYYSYWLIGSMAPNTHEEMYNYYWNYKHLPTMFPDIDFKYYPQQYEYKKGETHSLEFDRIYAIDYSKLDFYNLLWNEALNYVTPVNNVDFYSKDWEGYAKGHIEEFKDNDQHAGDRYVPGRGYYASPKKDSVSHGHSNVVWGGTASILNGTLYYTMATENQKDYDFYLERLKDVNFKRWQDSAKDNTGWINENWSEKDGYNMPWSSMWSSLDMGAYNLYNIYKITNDKELFTVFKRFIDYFKDTLVKDKISFGEHWNDVDNDWYYLTPESAFTKAEKIEKGDDTKEYPGSMAVYSYMLLLTYDETNEEIYKTNALKHMEFINTFLDKTDKFWTLCRTLKPNGFAFAIMSNIKLYELTKNEKYLDYAEEWTYLLLAFYHIRSEGGNEIGLAHAGGYGEFDYVCVASLETMEPMYLAANLLKYRENKTLLDYLTIAYRRHLIAYPASHTDSIKYDGNFQNLYKYIPMEVIPQRYSFAMYMAGPIMIENVMFDALHQTSDNDVTVICLNAAREDTNLKTNRDIIAYNPNPEKKSINLKIKHLANGIFRITFPEKQLIPDMSQKELEEKGINVDIEGRTAVRISLTIRQ